MPTASCATFANGARQFVVHDALEMTSCLSLSYWSSLTPSTIVRSGSVAGAEMTTFFAPASRGLAASGRFVKKPVDSSTTSTPRSFHGSCAGSRSSRTLISLPSTIRPSPRTSTEPWYGPRIESYLSRWASVALSVMSLTATHSMSVSFARPARSTFRPMRPNPLIPTRTGMCSVPSAVSIQERGEATARGPPSACRPAAFSLGRAAHELEPGAVGIDQISGVVVGRAERPRGGRAAVTAAGGEPGLVGGVDGAPAGGGDPDVARSREGGAVAGRAPGRVGRSRHDPEVRAIAPVADAVRAGDDAPAAKRAHDRVVEPRGAGEVGDLQGDVVEHCRGVLAAEPVGFGGRRVVVAVLRHRIAGAEGRELARPTARVGVAVAARAIGVAMHDLDEDVVARGVPLAEVLGDRDRAVPAAGAADRDREVRLAFGDVLRQQEVEQRDDALVELGEAPVALDVGDDARVVAGQRPERRLVVRVGEEAHVEHEVGVAGGAVLEAEALERDRQARRRRAREELVGDLAAQHVRLQAGRVDDDVRALLDRLEHRALGGDAARDARPRRGRVPAARLLVAREERLLVGVEEEDAVVQAEGGEVVENGAERLEVVAPADVGHDGRALDLRALVHEELDERPDHLGREVVDAEVARVLEDGHGGRLAGAGVTGDDDEVLEARVGVEAGPVRPGIGVGGVGCVGGVGGGGGGRAVGGRGAPVARAGGGGR